MQVINNHSTTLGEQVIKTLLYFDIFNYPLKAQEVFNFLRVNSSSETAVVRCLNALAEKNISSVLAIFILQADENIIHRRIKGNAEADKFLNAAKTKASLIARFPFVRAVMASGSLSKGYMHEKSDLDFYIVTEPERLWIARTLLVMYKRIFLFNSNKHFCVNYFIDTAHLEIEEKNLFTATELATLIPLYNVGCYSALQSSNEWVQDFFPNFREKRMGDPENTHSQFLGKIIEYFAQSGPETIWIGAESGSQKILDAMDKGISVGQIAQASRLLKQKKLDLGFFLQFGYLGETLQDIKDTI